MISNVGKVIKTLLAANADFTALVGTKVYPQRAPQNTDYPYCVYSIISSIPVDTKDRPASLDAVRVQIDIFSNTYAEAQALTGYLRTAIDAKTGTISGVKVDGILYITEEDLYSEDQDVFGKSSDYSFRIKY